MLLCLCFLYVMYLSWVLISLHVLVSQNPKQNKKIDVATVAAKSSDSWVTRGVKTFLKSPVSLFMLHISSYSRNYIRSKARKI